MNLSIGVWYWWWCWWWCLECKLEMWRQMRVGSVRCTMHERRQADRREVCETWLDNIDIARGFVTICGSSAWAAAACTPHDENKRINHTTFFAQTNLTSFFLIEHSYIFNIFAIRITFCEILCATACRLSVHANV